MIRLYRQYAKQLLSMLTFFRDRYPAMFVEAGVMASAGEVSGNEVFDTLVEQVNAEPFEPDLIDKLVQILGLPHLENRIGFAVLAKLRKALMLPGEIRSVMAELDATWFCANCRSPFEQGDLLTVKRVSANGTTALVLYCGRCIEPTYIRCEGTHHHRIPVSAGFHRTLRKCLDAHCDECRYIAERDRLTQQPSPISIGGGASISFPIPGGIPLTPESWTYAAVPRTEPTPQPTSQPTTIAENPFGTVSGRIRASDLDMNPWRGLRPEPSEPSVTRAIRDLARAREQIMDEISGDSYHTDAPSDRLERDE